MGIFPYEIVLRDIPFRKKLWAQNNNFSGVNEPVEIVFGGVKGPAEIISAGSMNPP
jgi:hypothetical protein